MSGDKDIFTFFFIIKEIQAHSYVRMAIPMNWKSMQKIPNETLLNGSRVADHPAL